MHNATTLVVVLCLFVCLFVCLALSNNQKTLYMYTGPGIALALHLDKQNRTKMNEMLKAAGAFFLFLFFSSYMLFFIYLFVIVILSFILCFLGATSHNERFGKMFIRKPVLPLVFGTFFFFLLFTYQTPSSSNHQVCQDVRMTV